MAYPPRDTVAGIVNAIQAEFALQQSANDATAAQLMSLVNSAGKELVLTYPWQQLSRDYTVTTDGVSSEYVLPTDWAYFVDQTQWDQTNGWPLMGPTSPQQWKWVQSSSVLSGRLRYRVRNNKFQVLPTTTSASIVMEYISGEWVENTGGTESYRDIQNTDNVVRLDPFLLQKFGKLKFWEIKGFDTTAFRDDFLRAFYALVGKDKGAPVLSLARSNRFPYITVNNVPDGSWGV